MPFFTGHLPVLSFDLFTRTLGEKQKTLTNVRVLFLMNKRSDHFFIAVSKTSKAAFALDIWAYFLAV